MNNIAVNAMGAYEAYEEVADAKIYYLSNKPITKNAQGQCIFTAGSTVFKLSGDGFFVSTDGGAHYVNGYSGGELVVNVLNAIGINAEWIKAGTINAARIGAESITAAKIASNAITAAKINASAVTADKIASGAVTTGKIEAGAVTTNKIDAGAVTASKISVNNLKAINVKIGPWTIDDAGFTDGADAWVKPKEISCGQHGGTLVKMNGKSSGSSDGYLSVEVNSSSDWVRVYTSYIERKGAGSDKYVKWWDGSDERIKEDIKPLSLEEARLIVKNTEPLTFKYKSHAKKINYYGVTAQRMEKECEELGVDNPFVHYGEMQGDLMNVDYEQFIMPILKVVQNQQEEIDLLKQELADVKARIK